MVRREPHIEVAWVGPQERAVTTRTTLWDELSDDEKKALIVQAHEDLDELSEEEFGGTK